MPPAPSMPPPVDVVLAGRPELMCVPPVASLLLSRLATTVLAPLTFSQPFLPPPATQCRCSSAAWDRWVRSPGVRDRGHTVKMPTARLPHQLMIGQRFSHVMQRLGGEL